ncbi:hypothetical protein SGRA_3865 [Saprospira grandis str. Lewin]|uniref:Uncharacterized protein n=1 Tax=Saprospira grandis (strain Lewin) TaxID=984262 RepID=H6L621_SAPGL|nr:hypothetical protein SGRA_3865 [Saprospira grandis str. Lewin]
MMIFGPLIFPKRNFNPCFFMEVFKPPFKMKCLFVAWGAVEKDIS